MIEQKTMFGIAAVGLSAVVGYGVYKYVQGKQQARKIKEAVDEMVWREIFMIYKLGFVIQICCSSLEIDCSEIALKSSLLSVLRIVNEQMVLKNCFLRCHQMWPEKSL